MPSTYHTLGPDTAKYCFYLPTLPLFPDNWQHNQVDAVASLIALNGNHWRKIFTIMAKIMCPSEDWKTYRDHFLLKEKEQIHINTKVLSSTAQVHIISGQASADKLTLNLTDFSPISSNPRLTMLQTCLHVPYLDYRQYPNALIEVTRDYLASLDIKNEINEATIE